MSKFFCCINNANYTNIALYVKIPFTNVTGPHCYIQMVTGSSLRPETCHPASK